MINFNPKLASLTFTEFKKFFKKFENSVKETPEEVYTSLGGKLPKKTKSKKGA